MSFSLVPFGCRIWCDEVIAVRPSTTKVCSSRGFMLLSLVRWCLSSIGPLISLAQWKTYTDRPSAAGVAVVVVHTDLV